MLRSKENPVLAKHPFARSARQFTVDFQFTITRKTYFGSPDFTSYFRIFTCDMAD
ncbi:hypothetical protein ACR782_13135 [Sphingobacterium spiritivorum]|uniref:hypothetical protein n=1 Tax=Sphingobacterium spiritivorum TaxID=258 RepID=UPI003DA6B734